MEQIQIYSSFNTYQGNDHQTTGLWLKHIPTLHEYNQLITPAFYYLYRQLLSDRTDVSNRSWTNFNYVDNKILNLLGVRYLLTTEPDVHNAKQVAHLKNQGNKTVLYLHEFDQANLSGISAAHVRNLLTPRDVIQEMKSKSFDMREALVVNLPEYVNQQYNPVNESKLSIGRGGIHLQATSNGSSLLILPLEYSSCIKMTVSAGRAPELLRLDVALLGVKFERKVDVILDMRTGPFANPGCRLSDYQEWKKIFAI
jgi:hypothetical protein